MVDNVDEIPIVGGGVLQNCKEISVVVRIFVLVINE